MRTALVLGAGGLTGQAYHLGVLTALAELAGYDGREADVVVGTSAGSLVAAGLAGGMSAQDQAASLSGDPMSEEGAGLLRASRARAGAVRAAADAPLPAGRRPLAPGAVLAAARRPWSVRPGAVVSSLLPAGRTSTESISYGVRKLHGTGWPDGGRLRVCAVRARDARRVVFGAPGAPQTDAGSAVAASCAIPGYFAPVLIDGEHYVDGGGHSPTNADVVRHEHPDLVVVSSPMSFGPGAGRTPDAAVRFAVRRYLAREVRLLRRHGATVVVFQPTRQDLAAMGLNPMRLLRASRVVRTVAGSVRARVEAQPRLVDMLLSG
ncbi:MAG TPA: patatin-like phospholipase family protein [Mycobacteriales bacterium]|nr:patatin-like phospholipase family protein [Mycobacteriales bacterium]